MDPAQLKILQMLQDGVLSAEEAERLLQVLDGEARPNPTPSLGGDVRSTVPIAGPSPAGGPPLWWHRIWPYVVALGAILAGLSIFLMVPIAQGLRHPAWLALTVPLLLFGTLLATLAWWSRSAQWLHVRVRGADQSIHISLPLPLRMAGWLLRMARPWVPQLRDTAVDEVILALAREGGEGELLVVDVDDQDSGEKVHVSIG